jgi:hypothetical protein
MAVRGPGASQITGASREEPAAGEPRHTLRY